MTVLDLHRQGRLVERYPEVHTLLTEADLGAAGLLLSRLDPDDVLAAHPSTTTLSVAITGHGTLAQLLPPLTAELARHGILARTTVSDFDSYIFDLGDPDSALYSASPQLVLCLLDPKVIFDEVPVPWRPEDVSEVAEEKLATLRRLVQQFHESCHGTLVLNTIPLLRLFTAQLVDHRSRARLSAVWHRFNASLLELAGDHVVVLDVDPLLTEGIPADDPRLSTYAKVHLSPLLLARYAREIGHLGRHLTGRLKKVLAVDLDGTLWGGILGDDGAEDIEVDDSRRGEAFTAFQRVVKQIASQGVLLTAVSKNDQQAVEAVLRDHPRMTLRQADFVRVVANWRPKDSNITELADALGLTVDSFVFVDDSPYECGLVRYALPDVAVVQVDEEPSLHAVKLLEDGWFDTRILTAADTVRAASYQVELERKDFLSTFDSIEEYLRQLGVTVRLAAATPEDVSRISQLTLRTNQFNLTTERLQPADIHSRISDTSALVLTVRSSDRFGDNGLVGALFARRKADVLQVDNFVLSCRVFSRGIEQACLAALLEHARSTGASSAVGTYQPTARNGKVKDFLPANGFVMAEDGKFRHDLKKVLDPPGHVNLIADMGADS